MNKKKLLIIAAALLMFGAVAVKPAMAYFTDTHEAKGNATFKHIEIEPHEEIDGYTKIVTIKNTGEAPVFVRVKFFAGDEDVHKLTPVQTDGWTKNEDGFYYYDKQLQVGKTTEKPLSMGIAKETEGHFKVIVVSEAASVKADGTADWDNVSESDKQLFDGKGGVN